MTQSLTIWLIIGSVLSLAGLVLLASLLRLTPRQSSDDTVWRRLRRSLTSKPTLTSNPRPWLDE